jgi:hypothetical protein
MLINQSINLDRGLMHQALHKLGRKRPSRVAGTPKTGRSNVEELS